jgi:hypothetical protein
MIPAMSMNPRKRSSSFSNLDLITLVRDRSIAAGSPEDWHRDYIVYRAPDAWFAPAGTGPTSLPARSDPKNRPGLNPQGTRSSFAAHPLLRHFGLCTVGGTMNR